MTERLMPLIDLLNEMSPFLLLGFMFAGILHEFIPQTVYRKSLAKGDFRSVLLAALIGVPLPLCSCGVLPTAMSLRREGVSKGATVSFLISTPQTGVDSIIATASLLGLPFAVIRPIVAFVTALFGGCMVNKFCKEEEAATIEKHSDTAGNKGFVAKCIGSLKYAFVDMLQDIGKWIVIGLVIAAVITVLVPDGFFTAYNDKPIVSMLIVLAFSIPMYLCATGSIPIAAALMLKGLSPGAALVLLMAGPATNTAAILVINKVLGKRTMILYLFTIIVSAIGFGLLIDYIMPQEWFQTHIVPQGDMSDCCSAHATAWWKWASSILFTILIIVAFAIKYFEPKNSTTMKKSFKIKGMMCNHCKANVEKNIAKIEGVTAVSVDLEAGIAYVDGNFDVNKVIETIDSLGYEYIE
ncbi:MAG: permease [Bacteroidaceae bacterium]|nr:permease [Bacteroidaceae bacterium]